MLKTEKYIYEDANRSYEGVVTFDDGIRGKRPVVLVAHTWVGQSDFEVTKAEKLAEMGYLAFAIDVYGTGRRAANVAEAEALMNEMLADRQELLNRLLLAVDQIKKHELANYDNVAAIGFCFGGKCVLDLARSGLNLKGVVSFHGIFDPPGIDHQGDIRAKILALHGWEDPLALPKDINMLAKEMTERNAVWEMDIFGHTGHAFTNPKADGSMEGMKFNQLATERSWQRMSEFLKEIFEN